MVEYRYGLLLSWQLRPASVRQVDYLSNYGAYLLLSLCVGCSCQYAQMIFSSA